MFLRFFIYGMLGWCAEIVWTALPKKRPIDRTLSGHTQLWVFPLYGSLAFLYEPLHDFLRAYPLIIRGAAYAVGFMVVELIAGFVIAKLVGKVPWDYTDKTRWRVGAYMRYDYAPLWFLAGLALEPVHDFLVQVTPVLLSAMGLG